MSTVGAFNINLILSAMSVVGIFISWFILHLFGRRRLFLGGLMGTSALLWPIGIIGCTKYSSSALTGIGALLVIINLVQHFTTAPVVYTIASEVPSSRLRARTIVFGRVIYTINYIVFSQINPRTVAATGWSVKIRATLSS